MTEAQGAAIIAQLTTIQETLDSLVSASGLGVLAAMVGSALLGGILVAVILAAARG